MPLFKSLSVLTVNDQVRLENCKFMHRINYQTCPNTISKLYPKSNRKNSTSGLAISIVPHKSSIVNKSFLSRPITEWQQLSVDVRTIEN